LYAKVNVGQEFPVGSLTEVGDSFSCEVNDLGAGVLDVIHSKTLAVNLSEREAVNMFTSCLDRVATYFSDATNVDAKEEEPVDEKAPSEKAPSEIAPSRPESAK
jgi:hypothetical protein